MTHESIPWRGTFYGTTLAGGNSGIGNGLGTVFAYTLAPPPIALNVNKSTFSTTDLITVTADVKKTATAFYPFIRLIFPGGASLYYVKGKGFSVTERPLLRGGPFLLRDAISNYPVLDVSFKGIAPGTYVLEG